MLLIPHHDAWEWDGKFTWQLAHRFYWLEHLLTLALSFWSSKYSQILLFLIYIFEQMLPMNYIMKKAVAYLSMPGRRLWVPRELCLGFDTDKQRFRGPIWAKLHFVIACGVTSLMWAEEPSGVCSGRRNGTSYVLWLKKAFWCFYGQELCEQGVEWNTRSSSPGVDSAGQSLKWNGTATTGLSVYNTIGCMKHDSGRSAQKNESWANHSLWCGQIVGVCQTAELGF